MIKIQYCEKEYGRYFGGNKKGYSINFIDEKENFIGIDQDSAEDDNCIFLVSTDFAKTYTNVYDLNKKKIYEEILEKCCIKKENYLNFEQLLINEKILNGNINEVSEGVCYFELTNNLAVLFVGFEDTEEYVGGETYKQVYSCYNEVLTIFNKIQNKKDI